MPHTTYCIVQIFLENIKSPLLCSSSNSTSIRIIYWRGKGISGISAKYMHDVSEKNRFSLQFELFVIVDVLLLPGQCSLI